jgi:hypothetical protein
MKITDEAKKKQLTVYLPDTRGVTISRFGIGNLKIGLGVYTYSRLPGSDVEPALGLPEQPNPWHVNLGTCPGASHECTAICYASRPVAEQGPVFEMWRRNSLTESVPLELPPDCKFLRIHISGDFTTPEYINDWTRLLLRNPEVTVWAYTRSWRVPELLPALEALRSLPNVQLFASMDLSIAEMPPHGWRRAWIDGDARADIGRLSTYNRQTVDGTYTLVCPEETGDKPNCLACGYCLKGDKNDVTFLKH